MIGWIQLGFNEWRVSSREMPGSQLVEVHHLGAKDVIAAVKEMIDAGFTFDPALEDHEAFMRLEAAYNKYMKDQ